MSRRWIHAVYYKYLFYVDLHTVSCTGLSKGGVTVGIIPDSEALKKIKARGSSKNKIK